MPGFVAAKTSCSLLPLHKRPVTARAATGVASRPVMAGAPAVMPG
jgi:hypothetical protein